jgi:flagellar motor protein MotB
LIRRRRLTLFPVNVWPPFVDALTLVLAGFVVLILVALVAQRGLLGRLRERDQELSKLRDDKARIERRLGTLAPRGSIDIEEGKVILQGEVLFESGRDAVRAEGARLMTEIGKSLATLLAAEPDQMVLVGGHTDNWPIHDSHFASNWDLSTARAVAVTRVLMAAGLQQSKVVAAGFGEFHPRASNDDEDGRRKNRRIEVLVVPITAVSSR